MTPVVEGLANCIGLPAANSSSAYCWLASLRYFEGSIFIPIFPARLKIAALASLNVVNFNPIIHFSAAPYVPSLEFTSQARHWVTPGLTATPHEHWPGRVRLRNTFIALSVFASSVSSLRLASIIRLLILALA